MRALLTSESFLSHFGLPSKSNNCGMSAHPFILSRVYSQGNYSKHPAKDIIDAIKKSQEIKHSKNGTLFKTEVSLNPFEYQIISFAKQIGPKPTRKTGGSKADPPAFCDPPKKDAPCKLQPGSSNEVLQPASNKDEKMKPAAKTEPGKPESPKAPNRKANEKRLDHKQTTDKKKPLKKPSRQDTKMIAENSNPSKKQDQPKAAKKKSLKSPSQHDMKIVAAKSNPPGKPEPPKTAVKEANEKGLQNDKTLPIKSSSQHDMKIVAVKSNPAGRLKPSKAAEDKMEPIKSPSQHKIKSAPSTNRLDAGQIRSGLRSPPMQSEKTASKKVKSPARKKMLDANPIPIIPGFPVGKFPCLDKAADKKQESEDDSKSFNKKEKEKLPEGDKCYDSKKDQNKDYLMSKSNGKKSTDDSCNKSKDHNQRKEPKESRLKHIINDDCRKLKKSTKKYDGDMTLNANDSSSKSEDSKYPPIPPKQTADGKIYRSPLEEKARGKLKEVKEGKEAHPKTEATVHKTSDSMKSALEDPNSKEKTADYSAKSSKPSISSSKNTKETESCEDNARQNLLTYPVTPLKETLDRYLCSVKPLVDDDLFNLEQQLVKEFLDKDGAQLQAFLEKEANLKTNWLTERWTNAAYLEVRTPLTVYTSPCLAFPLQKFLHPIDYITFVAKCIYGMLEFKKIVDEHKIPVVKMCQYELDNSQFGKIFGGVRIPLPCMDAFEQYSHSDYVIVINKNNFYKLPVYNCDGKIVHVHALRDQLDGIVNGQSEHGDTMGLLTHDTRDNWAEVHEFLRRDEDNCRILSVIEKALFAVCMDEYVDLPPEGEQRNLQAAHLLHGGGRHLNSANRWMDKTLQLIVNPNGFSGICFEHSPADCQPLAMLMDLLQKNIRQPGYGCESCNDGKVKPFTPLIFKPLNQCTELWMSVAERNIDSLCKHFQLNVFKFHCHGKNFIMAQGLNADSYIQIALQLAFYLMHKELPSQYESAHLRIFKGGRTETIRSTTIESSAFIKSITSPDSSKRDRMEALRAAVDAHQELMKLALLGRGVDRHLFGLQQMAKENGLPLPQFFQSPTFLKSINYRVLSSQVATTHDAFLAFGPLTTCGYGCCYNPRSNDIIFSISNWNTHKKTSAKVYGQAINTALNHMRTLVLETGGDRGSIELCKCDGKSDKK